MRDLRAELREWHEGTPVEWQPVEGDILVGFVREDPPIDWVAAIPESVVVSEERTGTPVTVSLASPQLSALFELHNPRGNDRIGIKCTGRGGFVMMMDRETESRERLLRQAQDERSDSAPEEDECVGATSEERAYIEQMLLGETSGTGGQTAA